MSYVSYKTKVMAMMKLCKHEFCVGVGTLAVAEVQSITPVLTGNLKKCIASDVISGDKGVYIGVTPEAPYGLYVDQGSSKQKAQHFLMNGATNAIPKIVNVATKIYTQKMGGK